MFKPVDALLKPRTVALVGASETGSNGWPKVLYENLAHTNFPARVYLVNPKRDELWGQKVYPRIADVPERVDLGIILIPAPGVPQVLDEAAQAGLRCALICASQFGENGDAPGLARAASIKALCERTGLRVTGPNCTGVLALPHRLLLYPHIRTREIPRGTLGRR